MRSIEFYGVTKEILAKLADLHGVKALERYYDLTDYKIECISTLHGIPQVFALMAFHATNAKIISNIVRFTDNFDFLKETLLGFSPMKIVKEYSPDNRTESVPRLVEALRYNPDTSKGLQWNSNKSQSKNKDKIVTRYAETLLDCAVYLSKFADRDAFLTDLMSHYPEKNAETLIKYFLQNVKHGFSVALSCDFLKEFDSAFCDLPKPDVHIKETLDSVLGKVKGNDYAYIRAFQKLVCEINDDLPSDKRITVYQLDRMVWLVCSGNFFLDGSQSIKKNYIDRIHTQ